MESVTKRSVLPRLSKVTLVLVLRPWLNRCKVCARIDLCLVTPLRDTLTVVEIPTVVPTPTASLGLKYIKSWNLELKGSVSTGTVNSLVKYVTAAPTAAVVKPAYLSILRIFSLGKKSRILAVSVPIPIESPTATLGAIKLTLISVIIPV